MTINDSRLGRRGAAVRARAVRQDRAGRRLLGGVAQQRREPARQLLHPALRRRGPHASWVAGRLRRLGGEPGRRPRHGGARLDGAQLLFGERR